MTQTCWGEPGTDTAIAGNDHLGVCRVAGGELPGPWCHLVAISSDLADEVPADPFVAADRVVLPAAGPEPPLRGACSLPVLGPS
jgi:hypothetical protein